LAKEEGFLYIASMPAMRELQNRGIDVHWSCDGHWTAEAHDQAADLLAEEIIRAGLLNKRNRSLETNSN
jgi:hypothetical protein